jgi:hypothetical protein
MTIQPFPDQNLRNGTLDALVGRLSRGKKVQQPRSSLSGGLVHEPDEYIDAGDGHALRRLG